MAKKKKGPIAREPKVDSPRLLLTQKQHQFVFYFIGEANGNGTEAARLAGYAKPSEQAYENLRKPQIRAAIDAHLSTLAMSSAEVLARLTDMARADVSDFDGLIKFEVSEDGEHSMTFDLAGAKAAGKSRLIREIIPSKYGVTIKLHDAQAALEKLGRYHGLFKDQGEGRQQAASDIDDVRTELDRIKAQGDS